MASKKEDGSFKEFLHLASRSSYGHLIWDLMKEQIVFVNDAMVKITEITRDLLMEHPGVVMNALTEEEQEYLRIRFGELKHQGVVEDVQVRLTLNQTTKVLSLSAYLSSGGTQVIAIVRDISKPKEHEDYLINFGAKKDALLDSVSQSLSTPLNLSQFTVDLIEKAIKEKKFHKINAHTALIREVTSECIRIIDHFMQEEHMQSPDIFTKANRFDMIAKIRIVLDSLMSNSPEKKFRLNSEASHLFVTGDDLKFFQIIHNLLSNALKFTPANGLIEVTVRQDKQKVKITVQDDGIGIPEALQPHIFQKESKAARPGLRGEVSNGIGLYVVKKLTDLMKGKIWFESKENHGTRFILELPKN